MTVDFRQLSIPSISRFLSFLRYKLDIGTNLLETSSAFFTNKGNCKSPFGAKFALFPLVWIVRKVPIAKRICHFAKNQINEKIIEFGPRSDFCNYLDSLLLFIFIKKAEWVPRGDRLSYYTKKVEIKFFIF